MKPVLNFIEIKEKIIESTYNILPNFHERFYINADASNFAIGAVISQRRDNKLRPVMFISRKLNSAEINYTVTEKECLAIIWAIKKFKIYLDKEFLIYTDHQALKWLLAIKEASGRIMRWILFMQEYKYVITYIKGKKNIIADTLSRIVLTI